MHVPSYPVCRVCSNSRLITAAVMRFFKKKDEFAWKRLVKKSVNQIDAHVHSESELRTLVRLFAAAFCGFLCSQTFPDFSERRCNKPEFLENPWRTRSTNTSRTSSKTQFCCRTAGLWRESTDNPFTGDCSLQIAPLKLIERILCGFSNQIFCGPQFCQTEWCACAASDEPMRGGDFSQIHRRCVCNWNVGWI